LESGRYRGHQGRELAIEDGIVPHAEERIARGQLAENTCAGMERYPAAGQGGDEGDAVPFALEHPSGGRRRRIGRGCEHRLRAWGASNSVPCLPEWANREDRMRQQAHHRPRPRRVQLQRSKGWRMPANAVKVDRTTLFGNPFSAKDYGRDRAGALYRAWLAGQPITDAILPAPSAALARRRVALLRALPSLRGKHLACWCRLPDKGRPDTCHAAALLTLANGAARMSRAHGTTRAHRTVRP